MEISSVNKVKAPLSYKPRRAIDRDGPESPMLALPSRPLISLYKANQRKQIRGGPSLQSGDGGKRGRARSHGVDSSWSNVHHDHTTSSDVLIKCYHLLMVHMLTLFFAPWRFYSTHRWSFCHRSSSLFRYV